MAGALIYEKMPVDRQRRRPLAGTTGETIHKFMEVIYIVAAAPVLSMHFVD